MIALRRSSFDTPCRVEIEHSDEHLHAHVELADGVEVGPGDRVLRPWRSDRASASANAGSNDASPPSSGPARSSGCGPNSPAISR